MSISLSRLLCVLTLLSLGAGGASAQTATPSSRLAWDQTAGSLAEAQSYLYEGLFDASTTATNLVTTCSGAASPYSCSAPFPALTPTTHSARLRAVRVVDGNRLESPLSAVFSFTFVALPAAPSNLRIVPGV